MLSRSVIDPVVNAALAEDAPSGDITSSTVIPPQASATAVLRARETGVFAGADVFEAAFRLTDPDVQVTIVTHDGEAFEPGDELARVTGNARAILTAERIGLNFTCV